MAERLNGSLPDNIDDMTVAVFDIDGTLAAESSNVSDRTVAALRDLSDAGVHVVLASGRIAPAMRKLFARMERDGFIIGCNGAITVHTDHDEVIGSHPVDDDMYRKVIDFGRDQNLETVVFGVEDLFTEVDGTARQLLQGPNEGLVPILTDLESLEPHNRLKVMYYVDPEREDGVVDRLRERFPTTVKTLPEFYELTHDEVDKWTGLQPILDELGARPESTLGVGDSENDLSWLPNVGISIAMGNAYPSVKDACDYEIGSNEDDAVADFASRWAAHRS